MKSAKAVMNGQGTKMARLAVLSFVTWTVVNLSMGTALYAADAFKLWKLNEEGKAGELVKPIELSREEAAVTLIGKADFKNFVEKFQAEPTHLVEGIRKAILAVKADQTKVDALKKSLKEELAKVDAKAFGGLKRKEAILKLIEKIEKLSLKDLEDTTEESFLEELLKGDADLLKALGLTDVKEKKDEPKKDEPKKDEKPVVDTTPVVGEVVEDNSEALRQAEEAGRLVCDRVNALTAQQEEADRRNRDLLNETFNRLRALTAAPQVAQQQQQRNADENIIPELLKALGQDNQQAQVIPPQQPQVAQTAPTQEEPQRNSALDQGIPQGPQPQPQQPFPYIGSPSSSSQRPQIALDLPTQNGSRELRSARDAQSMAEEVLAKGVPSMVNPYTGQQVHPLQAAGQLGAAKAEVEGALGSVTQAVKTTDDRLARMDSDLQQLKDGGRAALPEWVKKEQARLQSVYDDKKKNFENQRQALTQQAQQSGDPNVQAQVAQTLGGMSSEMQAAENELKQFNAEVESKVETGNKEIAKLKSAREQLENNLSDLKAQKTKLESRKTEVEQLLQSNAQQALAMQQPQGGQTTNVNRLRGATPAQRGSAPGNAMTTPSGLRGALGGSNI